MTDPRLSAPLFLFALRREASFFLQKFTPQQPFAGAPCRAYFAGPASLTVLVLETGVGPAASTQALHWALGNPLLGKHPYRPKLVLSAGYAGGLAPELRVGDLLLATEVVAASGQHTTATWPDALPAGVWRPRLRRGRVLTTPDLVTDPAEKRRRGDEYQALVVDMESAVAATMCEERGIPYGCLRAVSDDWDTPLDPALADIAPNGRVVWGCLLAAVLRRPRLVGELWRLARHTREASRQLGLGLAELLTLTLDRPR